MLRIFRGESRAETATKPTQPDQRTDAHEQAAVAGAGATQPGAQGGTAIGAQGGTAIGAQELIQAAPADPAPQAAELEPGFLPRGRMRRRARFLRAARELAYRDLGGLVFDLHRFGQRNDEVVKAKLDTLGRIDAELRVLESALRERRSVTVLREAGVAACPRCAAIHGSGDRFCPACGLPVSQSERPIAPNVAPAGAHPAAGGPGPGAPYAASPQPPPAAPPAPAAAPPAAAGSGRPPSSSSPPLPEPASSDAAANPAEQTRTSWRPLRTRPRSGAAPVPASTPVHATTTPDSPTGPLPQGAHPGLPATPASTVAPANSPGKKDQETEVLRPTAAEGQRTVAFDAVPPLHPSRPPEDRGGRA